jgi:2TM domain
MAIQPDSEPPVAPAQDWVGTERAEARKRVEAKRAFTPHLVSYVTVNAFLIAIWALTGFGYFWPVWVLAGWGIGLVLHFWDAFLRRPVTEADVDAELRRRRGA